MLQDGVAERGDFSNRFIRAAPTHVANSTGSELWGTGHIQSSTATQSACIATLPISDKEKILWLATRVSASDDLFDSLERVHLTPENFLTTVFQEWYVHGESIPHIVIDCIRNDPRMRKHTYKHIRRMLDETRNDPVANQFTVIEWINYILGHDYSGQSLQSEVLSGGEVALATLQAYPQKLQDTIQRGGNMSASEIALAAHLTAESINQLAILLAADVTNYRTIQRINKALVDTTRQIHEIHTKTGTGEEVRGLLQESVGRYLSNFSGFVPFDGLSSREIREQIRIGKENIAQWYTDQQSNDFGGRPGEAELAEKDKLGNTAIMSLRGFQKIEELWELLTDQELIEKDSQLRALRSIYRSRTLLSFDDSDSIIGDFIARPIKTGDAYDIETVRHLVAFDGQIPLPTLMELADFLCGTELVNPKFEIFKVQILGLILERVASSSSDEEVRHLQASIDAIGIYAINNIHRLPIHQDSSRLFSALSRAYTLIASCAVDAPRYHELEDKANDAYFRSVLLSPDIPHERDPFVRHAGLVELHQYLSEEMIASIPEGALEVLSQERWTRILELKFEQHCSRVWEDISSLGISVTIGSIDAVLLELASELQKQVFFWLCQVETLTEGQLVRAKRPGEEQYFIESDKCRIALTCQASVARVVVAIKEEYEDRISTLIQHLMEVREESIARARATADLKQLAYVHKISKLPNGEQLKRNIDGVWATVNIAQIQISDFQRLQDVLKEGADVTLVRVGDRLKTLIGDRAMVYHISTRSTFAVTNTDMSTQAFRAMIESLMGTIREEFYPTIRFRGGGVTHGIWLESELSPIRLAGIAVGKANDRDAVHWLTQEESRESEKIARVLQMLHAAIEWDPNVQIIPHYQWIFSPKNPRKLKFEALVRLAYRDDDWEDFHILNPGEFLSIAESTGLIPDLTLIMLDKICADIQTYSVQGFCATINVHEQALRHRAFIDRLKSLAKNNPRDLPILEILETAELTEADLTTIDYLRELGYTIAIDDVGAGNSTRTQMVRIRPNIVKLDSTLIRMLDDTDPEQRRAAEIEVQSIIVAQKKRNPSTLVVAECVETPELAARVLALWADEIQGYLISRPLPLEQALLIDDSALITLTTQISARVATESRQLNFLDILDGK